MEISVNSNPCRLCREVSLNLLSVYVKRNLEEISKSIPPFFCFVVDKYIFINVHDLTLIGREDAKQ